MTKEYFLFFFCHGPGVAVTESGIVAKFTWSEKETEIGEGIAVLDLMWISALGAIEELHVCHG